MYKDLNAGKILEGYYEENVLLSRVIIQNPISLLEIPLWYQKKN